MRVLQVVTLVSPDGAYGGPLRVALNQVRQLRAEGHDAILAAGAKGFDGPLPTMIDGVPVHLFPARQVVPGAGYAGLASPGLAAFVGHHAPQADVVHLHLARDLVQVSAVLATLARARHSLVVQTHGMVVPSRHPIAGPLDMTTIRPALRAAKSVLALTEAEAADLRRVEPSLGPVTILPNGLPEQELRAQPNASQEVLFLARLAVRKRPTAFVEAARLVAARIPEATFAIVGPDEGEAPRLREMLREHDAQGRIVLEGAVSPEATAERMTRSGVYVLPAVDEPFGMTVLEAMSVGLPCVVVDDCGLVEEVRAVGGEVVDATVQSLADAIITLLLDPTRRQEVGELGIARVTERHSIAAVARRLLTEYARTQGGAR